METRPEELDLRRVVIIGTSCSGKTSLSRRLGRALRASVVELDSLYWLPDWKARPLDEFRSLVREAVSPERWIVDGNYRTVRDLVWARATCLVWLNLSFRRVFSRSLRRTVRRIITRETLFGGNRETVRGGFFSLEGIPWWVLRTYRSYRRDYAQLFAQKELGPLDRIMICRPSAVEAFVKDIARTAPVAQRLDSAIPAEYDPGPSDHE